MFNSNSTAKTAPAKKPQTPRDANAVTILTSGCHFSGKLYCRGSSRIGGRIEGQLISEGLLIIEEDAVITADVKAEEVIIQGRVTGTVHAKGRAELCASCHFEGDLHTPVLIIREGAQFNGRASMGAFKEEKTTDTPKLTNIKGANSKAPAYEKPPETAVIKMPEVGVSN